MDENIKLLKQKFEEIHSLGWIKGYSHGKCSIGATFENLIGKPCENFEIPDFNGIEIKVKGQSNEHNLCLFNCAPDSYLMEVKRLKNEYGYPDKDYPEFKVFNVGANAKYKTKIPSGYQLKLYVNYKLNIIELIVYDKHNNLIDDKTYRNCMECHLMPDWLLVYKYIDNNLVLVLIATGSHSEVLNK